MTVVDPRYPTRFGVFQAPFHLLGISPSVLIARELEFIELAERLGIQEAWIGEHHSGGHETVGTPEMLLVAAAERTKTIRLGTAVNSVPYHNPFMLASRLALLDQLSHGRAMMGLGPGQLVSDAHMLGIDPDRLRPMMEEGAAAIVSLLRGERVTMETGWFRLQDAYLQLPPYQPEGMEVVCAAVASPTGAKLAGQLGVGMLNLAATGPGAFEALRDMWDITQEEAALNGHVVTRDRWRLAGLMFLADTMEEAKAAVDHGFRAIWDYLSLISPLPASETTNISDLVDEVNELGFACIGTPDMAIDTIKRCAEQSGGYGCHIMTLGDYAPHDAMLRSVELFASEVVPYFRGQLQPLQASHEWVLAHKGEGAETRWKEGVISGIEAATRSYQEERSARQGTRQGETLIEQGSTK